MRRVGVVAIGRNEGVRLVRCLTSLRERLSREIPIVYVDSGSTDGSVEMARKLEAIVIELDRSLPFTMARGRNAGFDYLVEHFPQLEYVQFIDGDCELVDGWLERAIAKLDGDATAAAVCGRRRERFPNASIYNQMADMEWDTPVGQTKACGGDALARVVALREVGRFDGSLICGEEPELCIRLRRRGWSIWRLEAEMTLHDADMQRFSQWWQRSLRGGWAVAEGAAMYGNSAERYRVREQLSGWIWGAVVPTVSFALAAITSGTSLLALGAYLWLGHRVYRYRRRQGGDRARARLYAVFCVLSKPAQAMGQLKYWLHRWRKQPAQLIEYKSA
ncbi:glycosyltransferase family 2 protein [Synechococcus sp. PCC 7336]|uniref:glycosyltransferase family 2 protein n=1 Tax=Synechococcus sp. PCC 7336 TaxID=195250 RepID=UPI00034CAE72|nr:glycosyltransferase [Synechococcus sp. PCC 7336]